MKPHSQVSVLRQITWQDYLSRFLFGGLITAAVGVIAREYGPAIGGLFLAFPSLFQASSTLIEKRARRNSAPGGKKAEKKGRQAVGLDATGAAMGAVGLLAFALVVWRFMPTLAAWAVLLGATLAWWLASFLIWSLWQAYRPKH